MKHAIIMVNYKTWFFIKVQLQIYYEFNNPQDFYIIIVDNSLDESEKVHLDDLLGKYSHYGNIEVIYNTPFLTNDNIQGVNLGSSQHGQGLDIGIKRAYFIKDTYPELKFCLIHDPDFFWAIKNHLSFLSNLFQKKGYCVIGSPYNIQDQYFIKQNGTTGRHDFPALFGCAFDMDLFNKDISCLPGIKDSVIGVRDGYDVGWQMRRYFSQRRGKYLSFAQNSVSDLYTQFSNVNTEGKLFEYCMSWMNRKIVAYHLLRGSQLDKDFYKNFATATNGKQNHDSNMLLSKMSVADFIYDKLKTGKVRRISLLHLLAISLRQKLLPYKLLKRLVLRILPIHKYL